MTYRKFKMKLARQLLAVALAVALPASLLVGASYARFRSRGDANPGGAAIALNKPQTAPVRANGKIAFSSNRDGNDEIYVMNADGTNQARLTNNPEPDLNPAWSADGARIAFAHRNGNAQVYFGVEIYVMNADGSSQANLTNGSAWDDTPAWSPDSARIAFTSSGTPWDYGSDIYVMNADGSNRTGLTNSGYDADPAWSPDGAKIAFTSYRNGNAEIYVMKADGSNLTRLTNLPYSDNLEPTWSPDGTRIAFILNYWGDYFEIFVMNADGTNLVSLTNNVQRFDGSPDWSPDGARIAFSSYRDGNSEIYVMNADGSNQTRLTNTLGANEFDPDWQALPIATFNPIDDPQFFVRQQYRDFLNREPDTGGLAYWTDQITQCGSDPICVHNRRIDVSAAFFMSLEFQQTGSFVYGLYKGALGRRPTYPEFTADHNRVIGGTSLDDEKAALANDFVQRPEFQDKYSGSMTNTQFVNTLFDSAGLFPLTAERQAEIDAMNNQGRTRAQVLRNVINIQAFRDREFNPSFVLMQYFGYMRRDIDPGGYAFWLDILNSTGNYRGMVCAFITSSEYQLRFGAVTRSNADCGQ